MALKPLIIKNKILDWGSRTYIMGILNCTPDSFSGDGIYQSSPSFIDSALIKAEQMLNDGADIIDVGGESTRPGSVVVEEHEEISRVAEIIEKITQRLDVLVSIDTYKSKVATAALKAGASIVNDVWAMSADAEMGKVVIENNCPIILMHNSSNRNLVKWDSKLGNTYDTVDTIEIISRVKEELTFKTKQAELMGIAPEKIIIDPGFGFGKSVTQNLKLLAGLNEFTNLNYAVLSGPSRKSFIGHTLNLPVESRLEGTIAAVTLSIVKGANLVRVHDVLEAKRAASFVDAVLRSNIPDTNASDTASALPK